MSDLPERLLSLGWEASSTLMEEAVAELRRLYELEAAVTAHRLAGGDDYGIGTVEAKRSTATVRVICDMSQLAAMIRAEVANYEVDEYDDYALGYVAGFLRAADLLDGDR